VEVEQDVELPVAAVEPTALQRVAEEQVVLVRLQERAVVGPEQGVLVV
jgi:hypothetical protein